MAATATHTTLRALFAATAVCALLAAMWTTRTDSFLRMLLTPCAMAFVAGLLGMSILPAFLIGLVSSIAVHTHYIATLPKTGMPLRRALGYAIDGALFPMFLFGMSWLTAWWWGKFLRYIWSRPKPLSASNASVNGDSAESLGGLTLQERMLSRCAEAPVGFFIITLLANVFLAFIVLVIASYGTSAR